MIKAKQKVNIIELRPQESSTVLKNFTKKRLSKDAQIYRSGFLGHFSCKRYYVEWLVSSQNDSIAFTSYYTLGLTAC